MAVGGMDPRGDNLEVAFFLGATT